MKQKETESMKMHNEMEKRRREYTKSLQRGNAPPQTRPPSGTPTTATVRSKTTQAVSTGQNGRQQSVAGRDAHAVQASLKTHSQGLDNKKHSKKSATSSKSATQGSLAVKAGGKTSASKKGSVDESSGKSSALREGTTAKYSGKSTTSKVNGLGMGGPSESKHKAKLPEKTAGSTGQPIAFSHLMKLATGNVEHKQDDKVKHKPPPTESAAVSRKTSTPGRDKDKPTVQLKKRDLGKSASVADNAPPKGQALGKSAGISESGPSQKRDIGQPTGASQSRSSNTKHHVTPTFKAPQSKEKAKVGTGRDPSSKGSSAVPTGTHQPKQHSTMKSLSFYHAKPGGTGGRVSPRLGHQRVSGSWLDQLGYTMAELQRKRKQQELVEFEDDDDMSDYDDGFVVDDEVAEDVDVSATIKELFGYDRKR